jgi:hypothetical protein
MFPSIFYPQSYARNQFAFADDLDLNFFQDGNREQALYSIDISLFGWYLFYS